MMTPRPYLSSHARVVEKTGRWRHLTSSQHSGKSREQPDEANRRFFALFARLGRVPSVGNRLRNRPAVVWLGLAMHALARRVFAVNRNSSCNSEPVETCAWQRNPRKTGLFRINEYGKCASFGNRSALMHRAIANRPDHARALEDARQHLTCAVAAVRAAAALDASVARSMAGVHACLLDQLAAVSAALESRSAGPVNLRRPS